MGVKQARGRRGASAPLLVLLCAATALNAHRAHGRWKERLDVSLLYDSNVLEAVSNAHGDAAGSLAAYLAGSCRPSGATTLSLEYDGGLQIYGRHGGEDCMVHDLQIRCDRRVVPRLAAGIACQGRSKLLFRSDRGYALYRARPFLVWDLSARLRSRFFCSFSRLDDVRETRFDYRQGSIGLCVERDLAARLTGKLQYSLGRLMYDRTALDYRLFGSGAYQWVSLGEEQEDSRQEVTASLEFYRKVLMSCDLSYTSNRSNGYGYGYDQFGCQFLVARTLPRDLTMRLYWAFLLKQYTDNLRPLLQFRPDTENEENSYALIDLSKDLKERISLRIRLGYYRNESPFRDLYYEKSVCSAGVTGRF